MLGQKTEEFSAQTVDTFAGAESHFAGPKVVRFQQTYPHNSIHPIHRKPKPLSYLKISQYQ